MKTGLSTCGKAVDEKFFKSISEAGIECIEVSKSHKGYADFDFEGTKKLAEKYGAELWSCHLPFTPFIVNDISSVSKQIRKSSITAQKELINRAGSVGIRHFVIHPSSEPVDIAFRKIRIQCAKESLSQLQNEADKYNGVICVENLPRTCIGRSSDEINELIKDDSRLMVCFDTNHLLRESVSDFIRKTGKRIVTTHVSDYDFKNERHWMPGEGKINWRELYDTLVETGYEGPWLYELGYNPKKSIIRDRVLVPDDFVRNAEEIANNKKITVIGKPPEHLGYWT